MLAVLPIHCKLVLQRVMQIQYVAGFPCKSILVFSILATCNNLICRKTVLKVGGKPSNRLFNSFAAMLKNKVQVFVGRFTLA